MREDGQDPVSQPNGRALSRRPACGVVPSATPATRQPGNYPKKGEDSHSRMRLSGLPRIAPPRRVEANHAAAGSAGSGSPWEAHRFRAPSLKRAASHVGCRVPHGASLTHSVGGTVRPLPCLWRGRAGHAVPLWHELLEMPEVPAQTPPNVSREALRERM